MVKVESELLTVEEAAQMLSIGRSRAYAMVASGEMPGVIRLPGGSGKSIRIARKRLVAWVEELIETIETND